MTVEFPAQAMSRQMRKHSVENSSTQPIKTLTKPETLQETTPKLGGLAALQWARWKATLCGHGLPVGGNDDVELSQPPVIVSPVQHLSMHIGVCEGALVPSDVVSEHCPMQGSTNGRVSKQENRWQTIDTKQQNKPKSVSEMLESKSVG